MKVFETVEQRGKWKCLRELEFKRWQERRRVGRDAIDERKEVRRVTALETLLEMEGFDHRASDIDKEAITLVLIFAKAFERVRLPVV